MSQVPHRSTDLVGALSFTVPLSSPPFKGAESNKRLSPYFRQYQLIKNLLRNQQRTIHLLTLFSWTDASMNQTVSTKASETSALFYSELKIKHKASTQTRLDHFTYRKGPIWSALTISVQENAWHEPNGVYTLSLKRAQLYPSRTSNWPELIRRPIVIANFEQKFCCCKAFTFCHLVYWTWSKYVSQAANQGCISCHENTFYVGKVSFLVSKYSSTWSWKTKESTTLYFASTASVSQSLFPKTEIKHCSPFSHRYKYYIVHHGCISEIAFRKFQMILLSTWPSCLNHEVSELQPLSLIYTTELLVTYVQIVVFWNFLPQKFIPIVTLLRWKPSWSPHILRAPHGMPTSKELPQDRLFHLISKQKPFAKRKTVQKRKSMQMYFSFYHFFRNASRIIHKFWPKHVKFIIKFVSIALHGLGTIPSDNIYHIDQRALEPSAIFSGFWLLTLFQKNKGASYSIDIFISIRFIPRAGDRVRSTSSVKFFLLISWCSH